MANDRSEFLTDDEVNAIRLLFKQGSLSATQIGRIYHTTRQNINRIVDGETHKHLEVFARSEDQTREATQSVVTPEMIETIRENQNKKLGAYGINSTFENSGFHCRKSNELLSSELGITTATITATIRNHNLLTTDEQHAIEVAEFSKSKPEPKEKKLTLTQQFLKEQGHKPHGLSLKQLIARTDAQPDPTPKGWWTNPRDINKEGVSK